MSTLALRRARLGTLALSFLLASPYLAGPGASLEAQERDPHARGHHGHPGPGHGHHGPGHGQHDRPHARTISMETLLALPPSKRLDALVNGLLDDSGDPDPRMLRLTVDLLRDHSELRDGFVKRLDPDNDELTPHLLTVVGEVGDRSATATVCRLLESPHDIVRLSSTIALRAIGDPSCVGTVQKSLTDSNPDVRRTAVCILGEQGDASVVSLLVKALDDPQRLVRHQAARALGQLGDPAAVPPLLAALEASQDRYLRRVSAIALCSIDDPKAVAFMEKTWSSEEADARQRAAALEGLVRFGSDGDALLQTALADRQPWVRERALRLRTELRPEGAMQFLAEVIREDRHGLGDAAGRHLAVMTVHDLAPLCQLLGERIPEPQRTRVLVALAKAGDPARVPVVQ